MAISPIDSWVRAKLGGLSFDEYRLDSIKRTMDYAIENSSFYRKHFSKIEIRKIRSMDDIKKIPTMSQKDIEASPSSLVCLPQSEISRITTLNTSGTTGAPKRIYFSEEDLELTVEFFMHGMMTFTEKDDRVIILLPGKKYGSVGYLLNKALGNMGVFSLIHGVVNDNAECIEEIRKSNINCIVGIPVQVHELSYEAKRLGISSINKVLLSTDYISEPLVKNIEKNFCCSVYSHYGMTEMGFGGGVECSAFKGYHLRENDLYFEIIDFETGNPVEGGCLGEVAFTTLNRKGMPLIRYRTGDISRFLTGRCGCGSDMRRLDRIKGRRTGTVEIAEGLFLSLPELDDEIFKVKGVLNYKAELHKNDKGIALKLILKASEDFEGERRIFEELMADQKIETAVKSGFLTILPPSYMNFVEHSTGMIKRKLEIF